MAPSANFVDLCRICATETQSIVRHFIFEGEGKLRDLSKKIAACLPVKIKDDDRLPKVLCGECVYKLDLLHEFREKSQKTEAYLFTLIDGPDIEHHVRQQSSSQLDDEEEDDDSHGGDDGGHDDFDEPEPTPPRRNAQGQICEPEVVIKVEEENSKGAASTARAAVASTPQAGTSTEQEDDGGPSSSKRPRRAAANKRPIREDSPSLLDDVDAPSSPPPPKRRGRKPKGQSPGGSATPGTSTSGDDSSCVEVSSPEMVYDIEPHFLLQGSHYEPQRDERRYADASTSTAGVPPEMIHQVDQAPPPLRPPAPPAVVHRPQVMHHDDSDSDDDSTDCSLAAVQLEHQEVAMKLKERIEHGGRPRGRHANSEEWERNMSKRLRKEGKPYIGRVRNKDGSVSVVIRPAKTMGPPCNSSVCAGENCKRKCRLFTFEDRKGIHRKFWKDLNWEQRKMYVYAHVTVRKREDGNKTSKKQKTYTYHLTNSRNEKLVVCKQMFSNTLSLGQKAITNWTKSGSFGIPTVKKSRAREKTEFPGYIDAKAYLEALPKHATRKGSPKVLENFYQKKDVYRAYVKYCEDNGKTPTSLTTLGRVFSDLKLSLAKPRKEPGQRAPPQPRKETNIHRPPPTTMHRPSNTITGAAEGLLALTATPSPLASTSSQHMSQPVHPNTPFFPQTTPHPQYHNPYNPYYSYTDNRVEPTDQQQQQQQQQHHMQNRGFYHN